MRLGPCMAAYQRVLGSKMYVKQRVVLRLALSYFTLRALLGESGLKRSAAVRAMIQTINFLK